MCIRKNPGARSKESSRRCSRNKRAQMQMGEAIVIVIVLLILFVFGFIIYLNWARAGIKVSSFAGREQDAFAVASIIANLPELHCSRNNVIEQNCYDALKISALSKVIRESRQGYYVDGSDSVTVSRDSFFHYQALFKNTKITVYEIYPENAMDGVGSGGDCPNPANDGYCSVVYDNPPNEITQKIPARIPILLYEPLTDNARFGIIEVVRYY